MLRISEIFGYFCVVITLSTSFLCYWIARLGNNSPIFSDLRYENDFLRGSFPVHTKQFHAEDTASACLIIKDDNPRLIEWLAYHYQVLPLRHLVVTSDPSAQTSPTDILERWRKSIPNLEIVEWNEKDYGYNHFQAQYLIKEETDKSRRAEQLLIDRQYAFYGQCAIYLKGQNRTWVFNIDSDEYVAFNNLHGNDPTAMDEALSYLRLAERYASDRRYHELGMPTSKLHNRNDLKKRAQTKIKYVEQDTFSEKELNLRRLRNILPQVNNGTVMGFIHQIKYDAYSPFYKSCYLMPRLWMSSIETSSSHKNYKHHPLYVESNFTTLKYYHHAEKGGKF